MQSRSDAKAGFPASFKDGRYEVVEFLGAGGQKRVYRAHDSLLDRDVAVAALDARNRGSDWRERFQREAQATGRVGAHRNIVTTYDVWFEGDEARIAMEVISGGDLAEMLSGQPEGRLDWKRATEIAEQICRALDHAHSLGVIHRDVKPENVWFDGEDTAKLGDFGLALVRDSPRLSTEGMLVGTVAYMSPEQATGQRSSERSDLYALGAVLYEMTTGRPPFVGEDSPSILSQLMGVSPLAPSMFNRDLPQVLDDFVLQLLAKQPEDRPAAAKEVAERLASIRATAVVEPAPERQVAESVLAPSGFVGRRKEFDRLRKAVDHALSGHTTIRAVVGDAGIGKTRLVREIESYAQVRGASVLYGRCYEGRGAPAYWPWVQLLRGYAKSKKAYEMMSRLGSRAAVLGQVVPSLVEGIADLEPPPLVDPDQARFRFFDSVGELIHRGSAEQPLVLVVEDLQWADEPSLLLLEFLAHELRKLRLLIVVTCRSSELARDEPAAETLANLSRESSYERTVLNAMSHDDVGELLAALGGREVSGEFVGQIYELTEGNPFFVEEMLRHLVDEGVIQRSGTGWVGRGQISSVGVPEGVRTVIGRRLSRLSERCREVMTVGAVIGREFTFRAAAEAMDAQPGEVFELMEEAAEASVLARPRDRRGDHYQFSHALIHEFLYEEIDSVERARLHRRVGEGLERLYGSTADRNVAELARHYYEARLEGDAAPAVEYSIRAAERANRLLAYEEAARHYERALDALAASNAAYGARETHVLLELADAQWSAGETGTARETTLRAADHARRLGDPQLFAAAALGAGGRYSGLQIGAVDEQLISLLEEALAGLADSEDPPVPEIMARLAEALTFTNAAERRWGLAERAIALARGHGDIAELGKVLQYAHLPLWKPHNVDERLAASQEMMTIAEKTGAIGVELTARGWRTVHFLEKGEIDEFRHELDDLCRIADELRQPAYRYVAHLRTTMDVLMRGHFEEAEELAGQTVAIGERAQVPTAVQAFGAQMYQIRMAQGRLAELEPIVHDLVDQLPGNPTWRIALAVTYTQMNKRAGARRELDRLLEGGLDELPRDLNFNTGVCLLSFAVAYLEDVGAAQQLYRLLLPQAERCVLAAGSACLGSASYYLGLLANVEHDWERAETHFHEAIAMNERIHTPMWLAQSQLAYAQTLAGRNGDGDRDRALHLLAQARPVAEKLDLVSVNDEITELAAQLRGPAA